MQQLPIVRGQANGQPVVFILDTGAETTLISVATARRLGLEIAPSEEQAYDAFRAARRISGVAKIKGLTLGSIDLPDQDAWVLDLGMAGVDGLLSRKAFENGTLTIDYPKQQITMSNRALPDDDSTVMVGVHSAGAIRVPVKIGADVEWFMIDTGFAGELSVDEQTLKRLRPRQLEGDQTTRGVNSTRQTDRFHLGVPLIVGRHTFADVRALHYPGAPNMIGSGLLLRHRVTIDQRNRRLRIE